MKCSGLGESTLNLFTKEALGCGALDTACTSTVMGLEWFRHYKNYIRDKDDRKIKRIKYSGKSFKFGAGRSLNSRGTFKIPAVVGGRRIKIKVDNSTIIWNLI